MAVPFNDLARFEEGFLESLFPKIQSAIHKTQFVGGQPIQDFENSLAEQMGVKHVVSCANGTDAIQLALRAMGIGPGSKVLVPDFTFWATAEAVINAGATPILVDVDPEWGHLSVSILEKALLDSQAEAVILVHLFGWAAPQTLAIRELCKRRGIKLIEDGAQAYGVELDGKPLFAEAQIATLSFYPAKVLGACADAGAVICSDPKVAETLRSLGNHGRYSHYEYQYVGWNSRLGGIPAVYLLHSLPYMNDRLQKRREICKTYREKIKHPRLKMKTPPSGVLENGYLSVALIDQEPNTFREQLKQKNIGFAQVYPSPLSAQARVKPGLASLAHVEQTRIWTDHVLNLPSFPELKPTELQEVLSVVETIK